MNLSISIAIPSGGDWKPDFCLSLINVLSHRSEFGEFPIHTLNERGSALIQNRHRLVRTALKERCTHILWLDDDMTFPADTLGRLLKHGKPIVGANCTTRVFPCVPTAVKGGKRLLSKGRTGMEEVEQVGLAVVLTEMDVFRKTPKPWFAMPWDDDHPDSCVSEDMYFCRKAKKAGFKVWVDHDLSNEVRHVGELAYGHDFTEAGAECR